jgi:hypothetical protein
MGKANTAQFLAEAQQVVTDAIGAVRFVFKDTGAYTGHVVKNPAETSGWLIRVEHKKGKTSLAYFVEVLHGQFAVFGLIDTVSLPEAENPAAPSGNVKARKPAKANPPKRKGKGT